MILNQKYHPNLYGATCTNCGKPLSTQEEVFNMCVCNSCLRLSNLPKTFFINEK